MPNEKKTGDAHLPQVERDLPIQGGSEDGAQALGQEEQHRIDRRQQSTVRKAGIVKAPEEDIGDGNERRPDER